MRRQQKVDANAEYIRPGKHSGKDVYADMLYRKDNSPLTMIYINAACHEQAKKG
jgi:hypothetical protein